MLHKKLTQASNYLTVRVGITWRLVRTDQSQSVLRIDLTRVSTYIPATMNPTSVKRTYLHLPSPHALRRAHLPAVARIEHAHPCPISFFRYLYTEVGRDYRWRDDGPAALPNYLTRGFEKFQELEYDIAG